LTAWTWTPRWLDRIDAATYKGPPLGGVLDVLEHNIPLELRSKRAWAVWRYERTGNSWSKPPYNPETKERAEPSTSASWSTFESALEAYRTKDAGWDGISFALWEPWGIVGIDLDHVSLHAADAQRIVDQLDSYTETTPGRDGLRIFVRGVLPPGRRRRDWLEFYSTRRFLTVTGHKLPNAVPIIRPARHLFSLWDEYLERPHG
jgi:putative DNA primase/helicase